MEVIKVIVVSGRGVLHPPLLETHGGRAEG